MLKKRKNPHKKIKNFRKSMAGIFASVNSSLSFLIILIVSVLHRNGMMFSNLENPSILFCIFSILSIILSSLATLFLVSQVFEPLEQISIASTEIAKGNYDVKLDYKGQIREFKNTIDSFNHMTKELDSVEFMRNDFIANVSHEFKTPLSSINGYLTLLQDSELSEAERNEYIHLAILNVNKLNDLTSNILLLSKLENQTLLPAPVSFRLDEQIREALVILEPKWSENDIQFDIELEELTYTGQQALLFQVWTNLIGNAIKFSEKGGLIQVYLSQLDNEIVIRIADHGIGMSEDTLTRIFEKFYQCDTSRRSQGNGLGLALCKKIMDISGGNIFVESQKGKGSVFTVTLPVISDR